MLKIFVVSLLIVSFMVSLQSCCTMIGHSIGKSLDEKNNPATYISISDSADISLAIDKIDSINVQKSNYKTLFTVVGILTDLSFGVIAMLLINPIKINLGGF